MAILSKAPDGRPQVLDRRPRTVQVGPSKAFRPTVWIIGQLEPILCTTHPSWPSLNFHHWPLMVPPSMHDILQKRYPHNPPKQNHSPIKRLRARLIANRPEAPKASQNDVDHRYCINVDTSFAQGPTSRMERFATEAFHEDAADRNTVGDHEGAHA